MLHSLTGHFIRNTQYYPMLHSLTGHFIKRHPVKQTAQVFNWYIYVGQVGQVNGQVKRKRGEEVESGAETGSGVPLQVREEVERLYKLRMPEDFYQFWNFCKQISPDDPADALQEALGLRLVGPFDILAEKHRHCGSAQPNFHLHWRFFYDPPELQTVLRGDAETQHHMGYYRDCPDAVPVFVGENEGKKGCKITQLGDNLFSAVLLFLARKKRERGVRKDEAALEQLEVKLKKEAERLGLPLEQKTKAMKARDRKVVTKTFHGAGIVVPVDKNDVGYRELPHSDADLKKICRDIAEAVDDKARMTAFAPIQEMMTFVQFANDECDYGMGYEAGIDLFCFGSHYFHKIIGQLLPMAYDLLKRSVFGEIIKAHLANRSHGNLDQLTGA
ncbi:histone PARylation factor 1 isoform X1 [Astyanax mexicanus]|uniref:Histone PARylation factor 1 isoform X1 n=1 Tax=Astyanax mexicanus TaxID=7994 RepID=A0A8T2KLP3_ASTMX|nr:histone PARylation factor 1 isoform X1 [Astyanax mexicanus]